MIDLKNIRCHYDEEFMHVVDFHQQEIMDVYKKRYSDDTFSDIAAFLRGLTDGETLNDRIESCIIAAAEIVYERHDDTPEHDDTKEGCSFSEGER